MNTEMLPRFELTYAQFQKYEPIIAQAQLNEFTIINPTNCFGESHPLKPSTFIARFRDAITGFKKYKHPTLLVNSNFDWGNLILGKNSDGDVVIENRKPLKASMELHTRNKPHILATLPIFLDKMRIDSQIPCQISYETTEDYNWLINTLPTLVRCEVRGGTRADSILKQKKIVRIALYVEKEPVSLAEGPITETLPPVDDATIEPDEFDCDDPMGRKFGPDKKAE